MARQRLERAYRLVVTWYLEAAYAFGKNGSSGDFKIYIEEQKMNLSMFFWEEL